MINSSHFAEPSEEPIKDSEYCHQIESPINPDLTLDAKILAIHDMVLGCIERLDKQQEYLGHLSQGNMEVFMAVRQQEISNPTEEIEVLRKDISLLSQGVLKIFNYLERDSKNKELKTGQEALHKAIEANQNKTTTKTNYLDWQQIATIVTATALISSLCSLAVFQLASNWKTDQPQNPVEKPLKSKSKKNSK
jgi:hypothetical protein